MSRCKNGARLTAAIFNVSFGDIGQIDNFATMDKNNAPTAPIILDTDHLFLSWTKSHVGNRDAFYKFVTTPSTERDIFINSSHPAIKFFGTVLCVIIK